MTNFELTLSKDKFPHHLIIKALLCNVPMLGSYRWKLLYIKLLSLKLKNQGNEDKNIRSDWRYLDT